MPILQGFHVEITIGLTNALLHRFATTTVDIIRGEPGNAVRCFGRDATADHGQWVFASFWPDAEAVERHFGDDWLSPVPPRGHDNLIDKDSICDVD